MSAEEFDKEIERVHKCPSCGVAVPSLRKELTGVETCTKCTPPVPKFMKVKQTTGGGNMRIELHPVF